MLSNREWLGRKVFWNTFGKGEEPYIINQGKVIKDINEKGYYLVLTEDGEKKEKPWHTLFGSRTSAILDALRLVQGTNIEPKKEIFLEALNQLQLISYLTDDLNAIGVSFKALGKNHSL